MSFKAIFSFLFFDIQLLSIKYKPFKCVAYYALFFVFHERQLLRQVYVLHMLSSLFSLSMCIYIYMYSQLD